MRRIALFLIVLTVVTKIIGFAREVILASLFGVSEITDAYLIASTIPNVIFGFFVTAIITSFMPIYTSIEKEDSVEDANRFTSKVISLMLIISTIIVLAVFLFTSQIVKMFATGFEGDILNMTVQFVRISIVSVYFIGINYLLKSYLNIKNKFLVPQSVSLIFNSIIILSMVLSKTYNVIFLPIGILTSILLETIFLLPFVRNTGFHIKIIVDLKDKNILRMIKLSLPVLIGSSVNQINILVDRRIASQIVIGGISALNYASRLNLFVQGIFAASIITITFPILTKLAVNKDIVKFKSILANSFDFMIIILVPITIGTMLYSNQIIELLYGRGEFDHQAVTLTAISLYFYSIGMLAFALRELIQRAFYSLNDTKTPMVNGALAMLLNIVLNILLSKYFGIGGLAMATSISAIFGTVILIVSLRNKIGSLNLKRTSVIFLKCFIASIIMAFYSIVFFNFLIAKELNNNISLVVSILTSAFIYLFILLFLKIEAIDVIVKSILKRFKHQVN